METITCRHRVTANLPEDKSCREYLYTHQRWQRKWQPEYSRLQVHKNPTPVQANKPLSAKSYFALHGIFINMYLARKY